MFLNPFANIERIIQSELPDKCRSCPSPPEGYQAAISELFTKEAKNIFHKLNNLRIESSNREETEWMVQSCQDKIDNLMATMGMILDELGLTLNNRVIPGSWHECIMETIFYLEEMMNGLLRRHPDLFDLEQPMSDIMEALFVKKTSKKICGELALLPEGSARDKAYRMLLLPFEEPIGCFCYFHVFYFEQLIKKTTDILKQDAEDEEQARQILVLLWKANFNHPSHIDFRWKTYAARLGKSRGKERVKKCLELRKELRLYKPLRGAHLYFLDPSLSQESGNWLNAELEYTRALMVAEAIVAVAPLLNSK
ncbi:hypothetical protein [Chitinophaga barathri]|nr:hypothetical protein [Chitinophaga barathri]